MKDVSLGQYYPADSFVHKLDPRLKLVALIAWIVALLMTKNFYGLGLNVLLFVVLLACSGIPVRKVFRSVKGILVLLVLTAFLQLFFTSGNIVLWQWWKITITAEGLYNMVFMIGRLTMLVMVASMLTFTTTPVALTNGLESLLYPLTLIRFPVRVLTAIMSLALRFIPTLMELTERIMNAQKARGADFESGSLLKRAKALIPVLVPLLITSLSSAEDVGNAMDARCYGVGKTHTKYKKLFFTWRDGVSFVVMAGVVAGSVLLNSLPGLFVLIGAVA